jgi:hypothetical protein
VSLVGPLNLPQKRPFQLSYLLVHINYTLQNRLLGTIASCSGSSQGEIFKSRKYSLSAIVRQETLYVGECLICNISLSLSLSQETKEGDLL